MDLKPISIEKISKFIAGDSVEPKTWPYKSRSQIGSFFHGFGKDDVELLINKTSRIPGTNQKIQELNGKPELRQIVKRMLDPRYWQDPKLNTHEICVKQLNDLLNHDNFEVVKVGLQYEVRELNNSLISIDHHFELETLSEELIEEHIQKCRDRIANEDYSGAITNARSLVEAVCVKIGADISSTPIASDHGELMKLFNSVQKLLNMDPSNPEINNSLRQVLTGLTSVVNGLSSIRNKSSDAHGTVSFRPSKHHAKLAVNSAKTLTNFLLDSMEYQIEKGLLKKVIESKG